MTSIVTGLDYTYIPCLAQANGRVYYCNDFDKCKAIDNSTTGRDAGITAPVAIGAVVSVGSGGRMTAGIHLIRYRYYNSKTGNYSDPSPSVSVTTIANDRITPATYITAPSNANADSYVVEMTPAGSPTYYQVIQNPGLNPTNIDYSDEELIALTPSATFSDFGHQAPPSVFVMTEHNGRMWGFGKRRWTYTATWVSGKVLSVTAPVPHEAAGDVSLVWQGRNVVITSITTLTSVATTDVIAGTYHVNLDTSVANFGSTTITIAAQDEDLLYWSLPGQVESWKPLEWARHVLNNASDTPTGLQSFRGDLYIFGTRSISRFIYSVDPAYGQLIRTASDLGAWNNRCTVTASGRMYGFGKTGIWMVASLQPLKIGTAVQYTIGQLIDETKSDKFFVQYDPDEFVVYFFFVRTGHTSCRDAACYDLSTGQWSMRTYAQGFTAGALINPGNLLLCDVNSYSWTVDTDAWDGVASGIYTLAAGSTTTLLQITGHIIPVGTYIRVSGEDRLVTAVATDTVTIGALSTAPAAGTKAYAGYIDQEIVTGWWVGPHGLRDKKRPTYLNLSFVPNVAETTLEIRLYKDFSATPTAFSSFDGDFSPEGITIQNGALYCTVAGDEPFVSIPVFSDYARALSVSIRSFAPSGTVKLLDCEWSITDDRATKVEGE